MLSAKTEVSTNIDIRRRTKNVPRIEMPPMISGNAAATTPLNTSNSRIASAGNAINSAFVRSLRVWSLTSLKLGANPPITTSSELFPMFSFASSAA